MKYEQQDFLSSRSIATEQQDLQADLRDEGGAIKGIHGNVDGRLHTRSNLLPTEQHWRLQPVIDNQWFIFNAGG